MKFTTVAASAVLFSTMAMAMPTNVVYETEVVTITSCAPEVTDCPYRTETPVPTTTSCTEEVEETPYTTTSAPVYPTETPVVEEEETTSTTCTETTETVVEEHTTAPVYPTETPVVEEETTTTSCAETTSIPPPPVTYPNSTAPVCPGGYGCPAETTTYPVCPGGYGCPEQSTYPVPTGTGTPYPPAGNSSTPYVPYPTPSAPTENSGASKLVGSFAAVLGVAAIALFA